MDLVGPASVEAHPLAAREEGHDSLGALSLGVVALQLGHEAYLVVLLQEGPGRK